MLQDGFIRIVGKRHVTEFHLAPDRRQRNGVSFFRDLLIQVKDAEDTVGRSQGFLDIAQDTGDPLDGV